MQKRERLLKVLNREKPDALPWFGDLDYWITYLRAENKFPEKYQVSGGIQKLHADLGVGFYLQGYFPFKINYENVKVSVDKSSGREITTFTTAKGDLREIWQYSPETWSMAPVEHLVKDSEDLEILAFIYENTFYEPDYAKINLVQEAAAITVSAYAIPPRAPLWSWSPSKPGSKL